MKIPKPLIFLVFLIGIGSAVTVSSRDLSVGIAIGVAVATGIIAVSARGPNRCAIDPKIKD
ncbi:MAG: hypothetical protein ACKVS5_00565 [Parvularculaceae bacterium]